MGLILLTSSSPFADTQIAEGAGIGAFLTKPARIADLYDCLATLLMPVHDESTEGAITESVRYSFTEVASPRAPGCW